MTAQNNLEENKRIVRAFIEVAFNQHQADRAADYLTADMKWHGGTLGTVEGRDNFVGLVGAIVSALPDLRNVEQDIIKGRLADAGYTGDEQSAAVLRRRGKSFLELSQLSISADQPGSAHPRLIVPLRHI